MSNRCWFRSTTFIVLLFPILLVAPAGGGGLLAAPAATEIADYCASPEEAAFLGLINSHRAASGVAPLALSRALGAAAFHYSEDMATNNYIGGPSHRRLDGTKMLQNMQRHGYNPSGAYDVAENLAYGDETAADAFVSWKNSTKGHNETMLSPRYTAIGVGRSSNAGSDFGWYWVTTFGSEVDAPAELCSRPTNPAPTPAPVIAAITPPVAGATCDGRPATIVAPEGGNDVFGTQGNDVMVGTANADRLIGLGGDDVICGGGGNDTVDGHDGNDQVFGEGGNDQVLGGLGQDRLFGGDGDDHLIADEDTDTCDGGPGTDSHQNYGRGPCETLLNIESEVVR